jgi:hypothetical protein
MPRIPSQLLLFFLFAVPLGSRSGIRLTMTGWPLPCIALTTFVAMFFYLYILYTTTKEAKPLKLPSHQNLKIFFKMVTCSIIFPSSVTFDVAGATCKGMFLLCFPMFRLHLLKGSCQSSSHSVISICSSTNDKMIRLTPFSINFVSIEFSQGLVTSFK